MKIFEQNELIAIYKMAEKMVWADEKVMPEEIAVVEETITQISTGAELGFHNLKESSLLMTDEECIGHIAFLNYEQKKFISAFLGTISSSDGDIDEKELELWRDICDKCDLPIMSNRQAIEIFQSYIRL
jgi:hypothetical protein